MPEFVILVIRLISGILRAGGNRGIFGPCSLFPLWYWDKLVNLTVLDYGTLITRRLITWNTRLKLEIRAGTFFCVAGKESPRLKAETKQ